MSTGKYILEGHLPKLVDDIVEWGRWFEDITHRRVALTKVGKLSVSTVFLGLDHNFSEDGEPILFETMIFGSSNEYQERYHTWDEAEVGHKQAVKIAELWNKKEKEEN